MHAKTMLFIFLSHGISQDSNKEGSINIQMRNELIYFSEQFLKVKFKKIIM